MRFVVEVDIGVWYLLYYHVLILGCCLFYYNVLILDCCIVVVYEMHIIICTYVTLS